MHDDRARLESPDPAHRSRPIGPRLPPDALLPTLRSPARAPPAHTLVCPRTFTPAPTHPTAHHPDNPHNEKISQPRPPQEHHQGPPTYDQEKEAGQARGPTPHRFLVLHDLLGQLTPRNTSLDRAPASSRREGPARRKRRRNRRPRLPRRPRHPCRWCAWSWPQRSGRHRRSLARCRRRAYLLGPCWCAGEGCGKPKRRWRQERQRWRWR